MNSTPAPDQIAWFEPIAVDFPFAHSVIVVRSEVTIGKTTTESRFYLSSLLPDELTAENWQALIRGQPRALAQRSAGAPGRAPSRRPAAALRLLRAR